MNNNISQFSFQSILNLKSKQTKSKTLNTFLSKNNFYKINVNKLTESILYDMHQGLQKNSSSSQPMIVASNRIPQQIPLNSQSIIIDAGGTNFRSCLVQILPSGEPIISESIKTKMPATEKELSKDDFYDAIAANLDHLKNKSTKIGFCFSYAMEITPEGDGKVLVFSKEIKAKQAIGTYVGKELKEALLKRGWTNIEKITLLNDTMACLLGGILSAQNKKDKFSSFIGFILGTGINNAYIDYDIIEKLNDKNTNPHIIVCECGMYNQIPSSNFDEQVDSNSTNPGKSLLEKKCSGAYLGQIAFQMIKSACKENLFSNKFATEFQNIKNLSLYEIDTFFKKPKNSNTELGKIVSLSSKKDIKTLKIIFDLVIQRSADIVTAVISASILKTKKGLQKNNPICIVANGTTFWKTHNLYKKVKSSLKKNLSKKSKRYFKIVQIPDDITLGTFASVS